MKKYLLSGFILFTQFLFSQTTLTQAFNEPKPGDIENTYNLDTSAYSAGLPVSNTGTNVTWDFSALIGFGNKVTNNYLSETSVPSASNYAGCNLVQESNGLYNYLKSTTSPVAQTELLGLNFYSVLFTFTNSAIIAKYPVSLGSSSTDNMSGTFNFSVAGTFNGNITTTADALGTLNLPKGNVLTNVLRVKSVQTITLSASLITGFPPTQVGTIKQTVYNYYAPSVEFPVLSINYSKISMIISTTPTVSAFVTGNTNYFVVGLEENRLSDKDINLYPNPVQNNLNLESGSDIRLSEIRIFDQLGQLVKIFPGADSIDVSALPVGVYMVELVSDKGLIRKKIVKE